MDLKNSSKPRDARVHGCCFCHGPIPEKVFVDGNAGARSNLPRTATLIPLDRHRTVAAVFFRFSPAYKFHHADVLLEVMITDGYEGQLIVNFLKTAPHAFFSEREIARKAGQKGTFRDNPEWAKPILFRLVNEKIIQTDAFGHYRLAPELQQKPKRTIPLAPHIAQALAGSDKIFDLTEIFLETP